MKSSPPAWYRYLRFWRRDVPGDIDAELRFHFEARIEDLIARGLSPDAARAEAVEEFGDVDAVKRGLREIDERVARVRDRAEWFDGVRKDIVYAARSLRRTPAVSLTIILTLALGLGINAAMFSLLDVIFLRPPAGVAHPEQLRRLWVQRGSSTGREFIQGVDYTSYEAVAATMSAGAQSVAYSAPQALSLSNDEHPATAVVSGVTNSYFDLLGVRPAIGRFFSVDENRLDAPALVVVISNGFWHRHFGGDPEVIGRSLSIADGQYGSTRLRQYTIIGIAPPHFTGLDLDAVDVWRPIAAGQQPFDGKPWYRNVNVNDFDMVVRLVPGANQTELAQRATARLRGPGLWFRQDTLALAKLGSIIAARGPAEIASSEQIAARLAGVAIIVLIIACANVINLLLARAVRRQREIAVRLALGISRSRLLRLLVSESLMLSLLAAVAAVLAAWWGGALLRTYLMPDVHWGESPMHWRVFALALGTAVVCGTITGLIPALQSLTPDLTSALKAGARDGVVHRSRLRPTLIVVQAALSVVLLVGAGLFIKSLNDARAKDIGYAVDRLAFVELRNGAADSAMRALQSQRLRELQPQIASIPASSR